MSNSQFISVRETAQTLGISEKKVMELIEQRKLQAYRIADKFLRLKRNEVLNLLASRHVQREHIVEQYTSLDRFRDFLYFNDFYIAAVVVIGILLYVIFYT